MATRKGVELRTDFTASDKNFQPVLKRTQRGVKKLGKDAKKAGEDGAKGLDKLKKKLTAIKTTASAVAVKLAAVAAVGVGVKKANEQARDDLLDAQQANMDVERFQKLSFVLKGFRIEADETTDIIRELTNVTQEAVDEPTGGKASAFKMLQIDAEKFLKLDPVEKLQALAEAQKRVSPERWIRASDEAISDLGRKISPVFELSSEEFIKRLTQAPAIPKATLEAQRDQFEWTRTNVKGKGLDKLRKGAGIFSLINPFGSIKDQKFGALGGKSPFNPAITFDPEGAKAKDEADKKVAKEASTFEKTLKAINKGTNPYNMALMGMTVSGGGVRPSENKMLTVMEKLAALNAKGWEVQTKSLDLWESELKQ
jgi:hypothetical protein